ncbi:MAG: hypothetical protein DRI57_04325 [Deltaproteobacteria bacterium]|nr:MAG: hypothetical protein DRI57_04325 [Deltaproteobacteria bacterium]
MSLEKKLKKISLSRKKRDSEIDWDRRRDTWTEQVGKLYSDIGRWLKTYVDKNYMSLHFYEITLSEEHIGKYDISVLELDLGEPSVVFRPVGRNIIGADGRVDVYMNGHLSDKKMLILREDDREQNSQWELWETTDGKDRRPFDREALERTLDEWLAYY